MGNNRKVADVVDGTFEARIWETIHREQRGMDTNPLKYWQTVEDLAPQLAAVGALMMAL